MNAFTNENFTCTSGNSTSIEGNSRSEQGLNISVLDSEKQEDIRGMRRYRRGHDRRVDLWALATFCVRFAFFKQWVTSSRFQQKKHPSVTKADDIQNRDL